VECDTTVKCQGISLYEGVADGRNCRLIGDTMITGPWIAATDGPWSTKRVAALEAPPGSDCTVDAGKGGRSRRASAGPPTGQWRWDETVTISSFAKIADASGEADKLYEEPSDHFSHELFVGETLSWVDADTAEACLAACTEELHCRGVSFYPVGNGLGSSRCKLAASSMDPGEHWIANPEPSQGGGRHARLAAAATTRLVHFKKMEAKVKLFGRDCTCKIKVEAEGGGRARKASQEFDDCIGCDDSAALTEIGGELNPGESRVLIHARTKILGLENRVKIEIGRGQAMLYMEGSLFDTFLQFAFGLDIKFQKPRSFRCYGFLKMESKDEIMTRVKASLNRIADNADEVFDEANAILEEAKDDVGNGIDAAKAKVEEQRQWYEDKAAEFREKADELRAQEEELGEKKRNLDNVCRIRCCTKSCLGRRFVKKWQLTCAWCF
jgi:hypothetical protein